MKKEENLTLVRARETGPSLTWVCCRKSGKIGESIKPSGGNLMAFNTYLKNLGVPLPELKNSPILSSIDQERELIEVEMPDERICYFNGLSYPHGTYIKSGISILLCDRGAWAEVNK